MFTGDLRQAFKLREQLVNFDHAVLVIVCERGELVERLQLAELSRSRPADWSAATSTGGQFNRNT